MRGHRSVGLCLSLTWVLSGQDSKGLDSFSVKAVSAAATHSLALASDGTVWQWGADRQPQWSGSAPIRVSGLAGIVAVSAGVFHNLAVKADGTVWAWGGGWSGGELTQYPEPVRLGGFEGIVAVAAAGTMSLALKGDGTVWAVGYGALGDGTTTMSPDPVRVSGLTDIVAIAGGMQLSLALKKDGTVWAWGSNWLGQLGDGTTENRSVPVQVGDLTGVVAIAANDMHCLAQKGDGTVWEWGTIPSPNDPPVAPRPRPVQVSGLTGIRAIAAGQGHNLAVQSDGTVWQWGWTPPQWRSGPAPVRVSGLTGVVMVAGGYYHSLALKGDGTIWGWGNNQQGQLGDGTSAYRSARIPLSGLTGVVAVAAGFTHSLALKGDGTVWAWGSDFGPTPIRVSGLTGVAAIAAGGNQNLALSSDGTVWAWGTNYYGQLGDGTTTDRSAPVQVGGLAGVMAIAAGGSHGLALKKDGTVWIWGGIELLPLCCGGTSTIWTSPGQVSELADVEAIAAGGYHSLAVKRDGTVWGWDTSGKAGGGSGAGRPTPVQVSGLSGVAAVAAGFESDLALKGDRTVWGWGPWASLAEVKGLTDVAAIAAAQSSLFDGTHNLALKGHGTVWAWGSNDSGQLGDGTAAAVRMTPVQVGGLAGVAAIAAGGCHSLAAQKDGTVWSWGCNSTGQLGEEAAAFRPAPVEVIPLGSPDLAIALGHEGDFAVGGRGAYLLTITNRALTPTSGLIIVTDILPPGLTFDSATATGWTCSAAGQTVTCTNAGPVEAGAQSTITLSVNVGSAARPGVTNFATVTSASDRNSSNNAVGDPTTVLPAR